MKLCKDCKYCMPDFEITRCYSPYFGTSPVSGRPIWDDCKSQRREGWLITRLEGICGKEGRWFEPKDINLNK